MNEHVLSSGQVLYNVHSVEKCKGGHCCIHNPSDHHMKDWPQHWRDDRGIMERICPHGVGHPDPDDTAEDTVHGCDGCCATPMEIHPFYGGPFSQWARGNFKLCNIEFNCAEQVMMACKALLFYDFENYRIIMGTVSPSLQKRCGRSVRGFVDEEWHTVSRSVVTVANVAKFSQTPDFLQHMIETKDMELVEASPTDVVWGIGLGMNREEVYDRTKWRGTNWLGECLMNARDILLNPTPKKIVRLGQMVNTVESILRRGENA